MGTIKALTVLIFCVLMAIRAQAQVELGEIILPNFPPDTTAIKTVGINRFIFHSKSDTPFSFNSIEVDSLRYLPEIYYEYRKNGLKRKQQKLLDSVKQESEQKKLALQSKIKINQIRYEYEKERATAKSDSAQQAQKFEENLKINKINYEYGKRQQLSKSALKQQWLYSIIAFVGLCLLASFFVFRNRFKRLKLSNELQKEKAERQLKEAEYKSRMNDITFTALRAQMNPHFIFNCLNSIKLYTEQNNTEAASQYLTKFSRLIRNMLDSGRTESITLSQELESLRLYLDMEAMRFKQKLQYVIHVDKDIDEEFIEIPPLLIQPYVENAIWHGLMHKVEGGTIGIDISQSADHSLLIIAITDDGIGREKAAAIKSKTAVQHKSYGTKVTGERIALINEKYKAGAEAVITDLYDAVGQPAGTLVTIKLPIK